jgi:hypothetical protein
MQHLLESLKNQQENLSAAASPNDQCATGLCAAADVAGDPDKTTTRVPRLTLL